MSGCLCWIPELRTCYLGFSLEVATRQWSLAVFNNPLAFYGFVYMSRHFNTGRAAVVFNRAVARTALPPAVPGSSGGMHRMPGSASDGAG